jgi:serine/threonine protein kinase
MATPNDMFPRVKNYSIIREIGSGGMSVVFEATDLKLHRTVALKMLHPHLCKDAQAAARFKREALSAARIDHPNVVRVYDYLCDNDAHYIVMEHVPGTDMESVQSGRGKVDGGLVLGVMGEIVCAMAEAHRRGIIHRDIKPANILIHRQGRAMLTDFGLAFHTLDARLTQENAIPGTPVFMSPEQISGKPLAPASDVYSWAVTLYFLICGRLPYVSQAFPDIVPEIQRGAISFDDDAFGALPACYRDCMERCVQFDPADRFADGHDLKRCFDDCTHGYPLTADFSMLLDGTGTAGGGTTQRSTASSTNIFFPARRRIKKRTLAAFAAAIVVCAGLLSLYFVTSNRQDKQRAIPVATSPVIADRQDTVPQQPIGPRDSAPRLQKSAKPVQPAAGHEARPRDSGQLFVYCSPWATVYLDERDIGTTPFEKPVSLPAGIHKIRLYNQHCTPREDTITITAKTILRKRYTLQLLE